MCFAAFGVVVAAVAGVVAVDAAVAVAATMHIGFAIVAYYVAAVVVADDDVADAVAVVQFAVVDATVVFCIRRRQ